MRRKNWNFYCDKKEKEDGFHGLWEGMFLWIAIVFLWLSFFAMVKEGYPQILAIPESEYVSEAKKEEPPFPNPISYVEPSEESSKQTNNFEKLSLEEKDKKTLENILLETITYLDALKNGYLELVKNPKYLQEGFLSIAEVYIQDWNNYYGTNYIVFDATGNYMPQAFWILAVVWWLVVWGNAHLLKKRIFYAIFPLGVLIMQFLIGYSPQENGILYLFTGTILLLLAEQRDIMQVFEKSGRRNYQVEVILTRVMAFVLVLASVFMANTIFKKPITEWQEKKNELLEWQENLDILTSIETFFRGWDFQLSTENLNNRTPQYSGKVILEMEAKEIPQSNLYLRGFYGTKYKNGIWNKDDSAFLKACRKAKYDEPSMAQFIANMPCSIMERGKLIPRNQYVISYKESIGTIAYVPYLFDMQTLDETYTFSGDYLLEKSLADTVVSVTGYQREDISALIWNMHVLNLEDSIKRREWYNQVASTYTDVPDNMEVISKLAEEADNNDIDWMERGVSFDVYGIPNYLEDSMEKAMAENIDRQMSAYAVAEYLRESMSYSLELERLPLGADPILFALTESHEGYCMHFASAATLLLREKGVPARYASGYVVRPSDFTWVEEEKNYKADILDYHAHAWVEIYLDYIGWVPFEVTPGYDTEGELLTQQHTQESQNEAVFETQTQENETVTEMESEQLQEKQPTQNSEIEQEHTEHTEGDIGESGGTFGIGTWFSNKIAKIRAFFARNGKMLLWIFAGVLFFGASVFAGKRMYVYYVKILEMEIEQKQTRKAVTRINRRIYRYVWLYVWKNIQTVTDFRVRLYGRTLNDTEYERLLAEIFSCVSKEDWKLYMAIVKKMYYSPKELTEEEMMHCYKCYRKL